VGDCVAAGHVSVVEIRFWAGVDQYRLVVRIAPDRQCSYRRKSGHAAQDIWPPAVDVGHVVVVAGVGTQASEGKLNKAGLFSFGGKEVGQTFPGNGSRISPPPAVATEQKEPPPWVG